MAKPDLISEGIDLAVRIGALDDTAHLIARRLGAQQLVICAAPDYLAERGTPLNPADLAQHDCIVGWQLSPPRHMAVEAVRRIFRSSSYSGQARVLRPGDGAGRCQGGTRPCAVAALDGSK